MSKNILSYFMLFLFFTQTVFAGVDIHIKQQTGEAIDILQHYIDDHSKDNNCNPVFNLESVQDTDEQYAHATVIEVNNVDINDSDIVDANLHHHHGCHGHITSLTFYSNTVTDITYFTSTEKFSYFFNFHSIIPSPSLRPPIFS